MGECPAGSGIAAARATEAKAKPVVGDHDLRGLQALCEGTTMDHAIVASLETVPRRVGQIEILPWWCTIIQVVTMTTSRSSPRCILISGPNGAGKTTFAREFLLRDVGIVHFVNADLIAGGSRHSARMRRLSKPGESSLLNSIAWQLAKPISHSRRH